MTKKLYSITIRGRKKEWGFDVWVDPKYVPEWREDGIKIERVYNEIPQWIVKLGLVDFWCWLQDVLGIYQ